MTTIPSTTKISILIGITILCLTLTQENTYAQRLGNYQKATKTEKKQNKTHKHSSTTQTQHTQNTQPRPASRLNEYHKRIKKPASPKVTNSRSPKRHRRFHRAPRRHRHYVHSIQRHRFHHPLHHAYDPFYHNYSLNHPNSETIIVLDNPSHTTSPSPKPEKLSPEQIRFLNSQLDVYENREGLFKILLGAGSSLGSNANISSTQFGVHFTAPPSYGPRGRNLSTWGIGYAYKRYQDTDTLLNHRLYLEGINTHLFNGFAHSWRVRIGTNVLKSSETSAGLLFGIHYELHNLEKNYTFNIGYDGILYNIGSSQLKTAWESNLESFFRIYFGEFHIDIGGKLNIVDLENENYFHQIFTRVGFRF